MSLAGRQEAAREACEATTVRRHVAARPATVGKSASTEIRSASTDSLRCNVPRYVHKAISALSPTSEVDVYAVQEKDIRERSRTPIDRAFL